ncbi:MAG: 16S rRNA processing protein RimM [Hyphomicrobiales bacterium]|nr:16S rRNA processing protein RimM [Hyphomicrobiales bacterium]MDE2115692.1 16S rRNA processing protein RimM [Hyphomicrobiales bacterium]
MTQPSSTSDSAGQPMVALGMLGAPHGVRGEIRLKSYTQNGADFAAYGPVELLGQRRVLAIERFRHLKDDMFVVKFRAIEDRDAVQLLGGQEIGVRRALLPQAAEEEFYHADLLGLTAQTLEGTVLGVIRQVHNFGAGDILEIAPAKGESLLLPFTRKIVPQVDIAGGFVRIVLPEEVEAGDAPPPVPAVSARPPK